MLKDRPFPIRLKDGAIKIRSKCKNSLWWIVYNFDSARNCGFCVKEFTNPNFKDNGESPGFCEMLDHYNKLYEEGVKYYESIGIPDQLEDYLTSYKKTHNEAISEIYKIPISKFERSGVCILDKKNNIWIADSNIAENIVKAGQKVLIADEIISMFENNDIDIIKESEGNDINAREIIKSMFDVIFKTKEIL